MNPRTVFPLLLLFFFMFTDIFSEDGYRLWLRYDIVQDAGLLAEYDRSVTGILAAGNSETVDAAVRELNAGLEGLLGLYFQTFSHRPIPAGVENPGRTLDYYRNHRYTDIPGIR